MSLLVSLKKPLDKCPEAFCLCFLLGNTALSDIFRIFVTVVVSITPKMSDNTKVLRERTQRQRTHIDGCRTASRIDLGLENHGLVPPSPLYYSGRLKVLGEPVFYAHLYKKPEHEGHEFISYHEDEIGQLYVDYPDREGTTGIFPLVQCVSPVIKQRTIAQVIAQVLFEKNWTQAKLAEVLGIFPTRISEYLSGKRPANLFLVQALHKEIGLDPVILLNLAREDESEEAEKARFEKERANRKAANAMDSEGNLSFSYDPHPAVLKQESDAISQLLLAMREQNNMITDLFSTINVLVKALSPQK